HLGNRGLFGERHLLLTTLSIQGRLGPGEFRLRYRLLGQILWCFCTRRGLFVLAQSKITCTSAMRHGPRGHWDWGCRWLRRVLLPFAAFGRRRSEEHTH